jgi:NADPH:quinone reductase-like Zn-dependent oxidoreductase
MKAIVLKEFGGVDQLILQDIPVSPIKDNEVLIEVKAISINPVDIKTRSGKGQASRLKDFQPIILGWDIAGNITETGSQVTDFKPGDEVFGMVNFPGHGQAYAEYAAAPAAHLTLKPANISYEEAAAATLAALTAWEALVHRAKIKSGDRVLIHAASGGVGHFAVQIAKYFGAYVIGTSSAANRNFVLQLGADEHIDYQTQKLEEATKEIDIVLDSLGDDTIDDSLKVMKPGGTIVSLPSGKNDSVAEKAAAKGMIGLKMMVQSNREDLNEIARLLEKGIIKPHISHTFSLAQIADAHVQIESGKTVGKVIVTP